MAKKPKKIKLKRSGTGAQFYQTDKQRKAVRDTTGRTDLEKKVSEAIDKRMSEKKMTPKEAGRFEAEYFIDMIKDTYSTPERRLLQLKGIKKAKGGEVRAMQNGGAVMKGRGPKFKGQS
jgi:DNA-dependent RNA polymerase auxiliary subunit epsilon